MNYRFICPRCERQGTLHLSPRSRGTGVPVVPDQGEVAPALHDALVGCVAVCDACAWRGRGHHGLLCPLPPAACPALMALRSEAARVGWPRGYLEDLLVHDRNELARNEPQPFAWVLRERGTHLILARRPDARALAAATAQTWPPPRSRWYWWDGGGLGEVPARLAMALLQDQLPRCAPC